MITFNSVMKKYGETAVVKNLNFIIESGEVFVLVGPSGSGKTTSLKMINQLISLTEGDILIDDKSIHSYDIHELRWNIGYVLQQIALFPNMTVEENIAVVPDMKNWSTKDINSRVTELLNMVNLEAETYRKRQVSELSGGQQQRVGVLRALAANPDILLMDEPFSALDPLSRADLQNELLSIQEKLQKTIVFVTHDMQEAVKIGDRICIMREGQVEQIGTPEEILNQPKSDFVKDFIKTGLPNYQEEELVAAVIEQGHYGSSDQSDNPQLESDQPLSDLLDWLTNHPHAIVSHQNENYRISQTDYLKYLHDNPTKEGVL